MSWLFIFFAFIALTEHDGTSWVIFWLFLAWMFWEKRK